MHADAIRVRASATAPYSPTPPLDIEDDEGAPILRNVLARERDPGLRRDKVNATRKAHRCVRFGVCTFDFEATYGDRARDFCEIYHRNPLGIAGPSRTKLVDLAVLCSNCHQTIHRIEPCLTIE